MKYISIDIETTGLNIEKDQILQFAFVFDDLENQKPLEELQYLNLFIDNGPNLSGNEVALSMNGWIMEKISKMRQEYEKNDPKFRDNIDELLVIPEYVSTTFGLFATNCYQESEPVINIAGKNAALFDIPFCRNFFPGFREKIQISQRILDPAILYAKKADKRLPNMQECLERAGIDTKVSHNAYFDCLDVIKLIRKKFNEE